MKISRRDLAYLAAGAAALPTMSRISHAQAYPTRPVRIIVGFAAGGVTDVVARLMGRWLSERLGQQFLVENRTGGGTNIAAEAVAHAPPDGYTLFLTTSTNAINATLYEKLSFDLIRDLVPVAGIADAPHVMEVNPSFPAQTVPEFIAYARTNPGKINMASAGIGSPPHVAGELFKMMTGVEMIHIPYRGDAPAIADLIGGQVQVYFGTVGGSIAHIRAGTLRPLAVTTLTRLDMLPDIPTVDAFMRGFEANSSQGLCAPKNTPVAIVNKLNTEINLALADQKIKAQLEDLGLRVLPGSPGDYGKLLAEETEKWAKVLKHAGIKAE